MIAAIILLLMIQYCKDVLISFPATDELNFANSSDPDQARHFVGPDLDPNCSTP